MRWHCCTWCSRSARRRWTGAGQTFQVGVQMTLRTEELLDAAEVGKLRPRGGAGPSLRRHSPAPPHTRHGPTWPRLRHPVVAPVAGGGHPGRGRGWVGCHVTVLTVRVVGYLTAGHCRLCWGLGGRHASRSGHLPLWLSVAAHKSC